MPLKSFSYLPLGTRFRYPGGNRVYIILEQRREHEGEPLSGKVAEWSPTMVKDTTTQPFDPANPHAFGWKGQSICSHTPFETGGDCPDMVEPID
jgi:hypothetical protein